MRRLYIILLFGFLIGCSDKEDIEPLYIPTLMEIPLGFPEIVFPEGNEFTEARWALGKQLFFDPIMSIDSIVSCASCHDPKLAFSDDKAFSEGVGNRIGRRNAPSLANVAYHPYFTREGGVPTLEMQVLVPLQEHDEFDFNIVLLAEKMQQDSAYVKMSQMAYNRAPDPFVITRAIACFERSLLSGNSSYDSYVEKGIEAALSDAAVLGMNLFFSDKTNCSQCHSGFNFSNYAFENNGLYENYEDEGRYRLTGKQEDIALFKVPSLRNITVTAPYMHDGSFLNLEEVIAHYNKGGHVHSQKSEFIKPLNLSQLEQEYLISFLNSLTDETFINNSIFSN